MLQFFEWKDNARKTRESSNIHVRRAPKNKTPVVLFLLTHKRNYILRTGALMNEKGGRERDEEGKEKEEEERKKIILMERFYRVNCFKIMKHRLITRWNHENERIHSYRSKKEDADF